MSSLTTKKGEVILRLMDEAQLSKEKVIKRKPVQKRQLVNQNESVLLIFKSMEIIVQNQDQRRLNPIYVPVHLAKEIYKIPETKEHELVKLLFENSKFNEKTNQFEFSDEELEKGLRKIL